MKNVPDHIEKRDLKAGETEVPNDDRREVGQYTGRDGSGESGDEEEVCLWVHKRRGALFPLKLLALDPDHALRNPLDRNEFLLFVEPPSLRGTVCHDEIQNHSPGHGEGSENPENDGPVGDGVGLSTLGYTGGEKATDDSA